MPAADFIDLSMDLTIEKPATEQTLQSGERMVFTVTFTNDGTEGYHVHSVALVGLDTVVKDGQLFERDDAEWGRIDYEPPLLMFVGESQKQEFTVEIPYVQSPRDITLTANVVVGARGKASRTFSIVPD